MSANPAGNPVSRPESPPPPPARILVVDDQPANIQVLGAVLGKLGHEIIPASDGITALKRLALRPPDLILLDLLMPEMDGCEVCRHVRQNPDWKDIPVIFLSAAADKGFVLRAFESGGVDYITKPFNQAELVSRVHTQLALKFARDRLAQLAEDKDELLGILTHDLKSHLGGMQMSARLLHDRMKNQRDERAQGLAENILRSSEQVLDFVKEYLANAAADHHVTVKPSRLSLSDAVRAAVQHCQVAADRKRLQIQTNADGRDDAVLADATALRQVLDNLLSNAVKFSLPGRCIAVTLRPAVDHVDCEIKDQGPGFTEEDRKRMFRRYVRLSAKPTSGEPSTGLGLSIARKLAHAMRGDLTCESVAGTGATFTIRLPRPAES